MLRFIMHISVLYTEKMDECSIKHNAFFI